MPQSHTDHLIELVSSKHSLLRVCLHEFCKRVVGDDYSAKNNELRFLSEASTHLVDCIPQGFHPGWLTTLHQWLQKYRDNNYPPDGKLLEAIVHIGKDIDTQTWDYLRDDPSVIRIDELAAKIDAESRLSSLLDQFTQIIQQIIDSDQIENIRIRRMLEKMLATLRWNRNGTFWAKFGNWRAGRTFIVKLGVSFSKEIPIARNFVEAYVETVNELDTEFEKTANRIGDEVTSQLTSGIILLPKSDVEPARLED